MAGATLNLNECHCTTDYDGIYHQIFSSPEMVAQLLQEFAAGPWLDDHDLERMTRSNAKFHAETGERREGDVIWQIPRRSGGNTYLLAVGISVPH